MKTTIKLLVIVSLFCSMAFADGVQGAGGFTACTENCTETEQSVVTTTTATVSDDILFFVEEYLELSLSF